jgi:hypothetical protein
VTHAAVRDEKKTIPNDSGVPADPALAENLIRPYNTTTRSANFGLPTYVYSHTVPANPAYDTWPASPSR